MMIPQQPLPLIPCCHGSPFARRGYTPPLGTRRRASRRIHAVAQPVKGSPVVEIPDSCGICGIPRPVGTRRSPQEWQERVGFCGLCRPLRAMMLRLRAKRTEQDHPKRGANDYVRRCGVFCPRESESS
jgi:hypothetical protein